MSNAEICPRCRQFTLEADFGGCPNCSAFECTGAYILPAGLPTMRCGDWLFLAMLIAANVVPWSVLVWGMLQ
jgi:hypothetical protein